ncbi:MAG TPA: hypothetical protein VMF86_18695 [Stellaceae bacterium]|nr:hypothetical protein [Stellaceae bacterium]
MTFRISANLGDHKPFFRFGAAEPGAADVEVVIDDRRIDRLAASRLLRGMAERLLECDWPPDRPCGFVARPEAELKAVAVD